MKRGLTRRDWLVPGFGMQRRVVHPMISGRLPLAGWSGTSDLEHGTPRRKSCMIVNRQLGPAARPRPASGRSSAAFDVLFLPAPGLSGQDSFRLCAGQIAVMSGVWPIASATAGSRWSRGLSPHVPLVLTARRMANRCGPETVHQPGVISEHREPICVTFQEGAGRYDNGRCGGGRRAAHRGGRRRPGLRIRPGVPGGPARGHTVTITAHRTAQGPSGIGPHDVLPCALKPGAVSADSCRGETVACTFASHGPLRTLALSWSGPTRWCSAPTRWTRSGSLSTC
jgi:hypothetical protein